MVFFFTSVTAAGTFTLYMGRDKFENEQLIKFAWPEDVWYASGAAAGPQPPASKHTTLQPAAVPDTRTVCVGLWSPGFTSMTCPLRTYTSACQLR